MSSHYNTFLFINWQEHKLKEQERRWGKYHQSPLLHSDRNYRGIRQEVAPYAVSSRPIDEYKEQRRKEKERRILVKKRKVDAQLMMKQAIRAEKALQQVRHWKTQTWIIQVTHFLLLRNIADATVV